MENKYYTPSIEEFHPGFEYEIAANERDWVSKSFSKEDLKSFLYEKLENGIKGGYIRVKHLDREDIEGFGFGFTSKNEYGGDTYSLRVSNWINHDTLYTVDLTQQRLEIKTKHEGGMDDRWHTLFSGTIRNKSELKRILTQTGIL